MPRISSGILMFRHKAGRLEVLLVHPGGPFWTNKDAGAWTIPKGEIIEGEDLLAAAQREFEEELGAPATGIFLPLSPIKQKGGKIVHGWCVEGDLEVGEFRSNTFRMEWPLKSGKWAEFPEVDRAEWLDLPAARLRINPAQVAFLDELERLIREN